MGTEKHVFLCGAYIPPINSKYYNSELFEELENDISEFSSMGQIVLLGDLNARTGKYNHYIADDKNDTIRFPASLEISFIQICRKNCDNVLNDHGKQLLQICKNFDLRILNGRIKGDSLDNIAFHGRLGVSVVDYIICDQTLFQNVHYFTVKGPTYLSDHSQIVAWIKIPLNY